jgi:ubiquitin carboxyl-terminal hydrolase L3
VSDFFFGFFVFFMPCWKPIEANPEILKDYTKRLGGPEKCEFYDVFSIEDWAIDMLPPDIDGLLLVYSITTLSSLKDEERNFEYNEKIKNNAALSNIHKSIWFMKQTVENACGTVALFHLFANGNRSLLQSNGVLNNFLVKTESMNPLERGEAFEHAPCISAAHHAIENEGQSRLRSEDNELHHSFNVNEHFIAFKNYGDYIVELDGRKNQPLLYEKKCFANKTTVQSSNSFIRTALVLIQQYYMSLNPTDIRFTIIAVRSPS